jgi:uncharacterized damage-inducible protein DinB
MTILWKPVKGEPSSMLDAFRMLAGYNKVANLQLYGAVEKLDVAEYRRERQGSLGSIHGLLNHTLLADRIWMARFAGGGKTTPPLNTVLFDTFPELNAARIEQDAEIERFFQNVDSGFLTRPLSYRNSLGVESTSAADRAVLHFFNHQTHHRGQVHVMLSQTSVKPPSLDLHRILSF